MGDKLTNESEVLFRQIHPSQLEANGEPWSQCFKPSPKDEGKLSLDRSSKVKAHESFENFIANGFESAAVFGLTVEEFSAESIECVSDPIEKTDSLAANPAHAYADYQHHSQPKQKLIAKRLKAAAVKRGCLHSPAKQEADRPQPAAVAGAEAKADAGTADVLAQIGKPAPEEGLGRHS